MFQVALCIFNEKIFLTKKYVPNFGLGSKYITSNFLKGTVIAMLTSENKPKYKNCLPGALICV